MGKIVDHLQDPAWWFTAFFVAIVASVIAGFLKEKIADLAAKTFAGLRKWRQAKRDRRETSLTSLLGSDTYLIIACFRATWGLVLFAISVVMYMSAPILLSQVPESKDAILAFDRKYLVWEIFTPVLGLLSAVSAFRASSRISLVSEAIRRYRKEHDLPKLE